MERRYDFANILSNLRESSKSKLLTLDDVKSLAEKNLAVYIEDKSNGQVTIGSCVGMENNNPIIRNMRFYDYVLNSKNYNVSFRCWSKLPSQKQMENTPWDSPNND